MFKFYDIHPGTDNTQFQFQGSTNSGSSYGVTITSTAFRSIHNESDTTAFEYEGAADLAQSTSFQTLAQGIGTDNDMSAVGILHIYNPSDTTFVKHFINRSQTYGNSTNDYSRDVFIAGYFNTTSAIDAIQFKMSSGDIDAGTIKMYGVL